MQRLHELGKKILANVPGVTLAGDQPYRLSDLAIDICDHVEPLPQSSVDQIFDIASKAGASAKQSSIHVNIWFGDYDKIGMTRTLLSDCFNIDMDVEQDKFLYIGDAPNDEPMFNYFDYSVGVANIRRFENQLKHPPKYITQGESGAGFAEIVDWLLNEE